MEENNNFTDVSIKKSSLGILLDILERDSTLKGLYRWNDFSKSIEHTGKVKWSAYIEEGKCLSDNDITQLMSYLASSAYNFTPQRVRLIEAITTVALKNNYHPIKDYLDNIQWDGQYRIKCWLSEVCAVEINDYTEAVGIKILVAAVSRIYQPGVKFDTMMVLEGKQGIKKSTLIEILAGKEYYTSLSFTMSNKELVDLMRGKWLLEVKEMHGFNKSETERVKALLDQHTDRVRLSYGRLADDFKRSSIIIGTMNPSGENRYLSDDTGGRRFWPILCYSDIDTDKLIQMRDQLWAEAVYMYKNNEPIYMHTHYLNNLATEQQEDRLSSDPWEEVVRNYLRSKSLIPMVQINMQHILEDCLKIPIREINRGTTGRIGKIVKTCGWERKRYNTRKEQEEHGVYYVPIGQPMEKKEWVEE